MFVEIRTWKFLFPVVGALFLTTACSSSDIARIIEDIIPPDDPEDVIVLDGDDGFFAPAGIVRTTGDGDVAAENISRRVPNAAAALAVGGGTTGGVSQTSDTALRTSAADFVVSESAGVTTYSITLGAGGDSSFTIDTATDENLVQDEGEDDDTVSFVATQGTVDAANPGGSGTLYLWAKHDTPDSVGGDDDYLAYGFWIHDPVGTSGAADEFPIIGAFVDGSADLAVSAAGIAALTGSATYAGGAEGLYYQETSDGTTSFAAWTADAALTANFDTDMLSGTVDEFDGLPDGVSVATVTLGASEIDVALEGGFVDSALDAATAMVTTEDGGTAVPFQGAWGGAFYDDPTTTMGGDEYPGTVAGTFGLAPTTAVTDEYRAFLGIFYGDLPAASGGSN